MNRREDVRKTVSKSYARAVEQSKASGGLLLLRVGGAAEGPAQASHRGPRQQGGEHPRRGPQTRLAIIVALDRLGRRREKKDGKPDGTAGGGSDDGSKT